jgi:MoaA/NifB/PqqE/SkfB family radical SAM enzyme
MTAPIVVNCDDRASLLLGAVTAIAVTRAGSDRRPIFRWDNSDYATFYAPGFLCVVGQAGAERFQMTIGPAVSGTTWGTELWRRSGLAIAEFERMREGPFEPECLTLYMNNECNLNCAYCHTDPTPQPASRLDLDLITAAAEVVAEACCQSAHPFTVVFHGGGEPTLHRGQAEEALVRVRAIAARHGVDTFLYIATNGILSEADAVWLAREFDLVGLSCDGPPEIHNRQRPRWDGSGSLHSVERTGRILRDEGCRLHVRTTITRGSLAHQAEIARFICQQFSPEEIHFEPVYLGGRAGPLAGLEDQHAAEFVACLLEARSIAREYRVPLTTSGTRPGSLHGPFCHPFRNVINLVPGSGAGRGSAGLATACFKLTNADSVREKGVGIGELNRESGHFEIDLHRLQSLRQRLDVAPPACNGCFNFYHCARQCPDACPLDGNREQGSTGEPGFRCRVQKALASAILQETAARLWAEAKNSRDGEPRGTAIS